MGLLEKLVRIHIWLQKTDSGVVVHCLTVQWVLHKDSHRGSHPKETSPLFSLQNSASELGKRTSRQNRSRWLKWANVCLENKWHRMFMKRTPVQLLSIGRDWSCFRVVLHREKWLGKGKNGFNKIPTNPGCNHNTIEKQAEVGRRIGVYESIMTLNTP